MQIVRLDSKFTPLLNRLARMPAGGPIPLATGYAPQSSVPSPSIGTDPKASAFSRIRDVNVKVQPPTETAPIVMSDFWRAALASAQKKQTKQPPNPVPWFQQGVYPSEDLLAVLRAARTAPATRTLTGQSIAGQTGAANAPGYAGGKAGSKSLLELAYGNASVPRAQVARRDAGPRRIGIQKINEGVNLAGETVDALGKVFPDFGPSIQGLGEIVDVAAIIIGGVGAVDALQRGDRRALIGCSLTVGGSVLGLIGALSGDTSLATAGIIAKLSKSGWTFLFPSEPPAKASPLPAQGSPVPAWTPAWPMLGSPLPPVPGWTPPGTVPGSTPPRPASASPPLWPGPGSLPRKR
jgi:hypothetical protein